MIPKLIYIKRALDGMGFKSESDLLDSLIKIAQEEKLISFTSGFEKKHFGETPFSTFEGSPEELLDLIKANLAKARRSKDKEGAWLVPLPPERFKSGIIQLEPGDELSGYYRYYFDREELEARKLVSVKGKEKPRAKFVDAIISDPSFANVTVFTIIASQVKDEPPNPRVLMWERYHWGRDSSSSQEFDERLLRAFNYWKDKAMWDPNQ